MAIASAPAHGAPYLERAGRPLGLWAAALAYAWAAFGPIPYYFYLRASGVLPEERWAGTTPFDQYLGVGLLYHGSAAVCCYLLLRRRAHAVWAAAFVALWAGLQAVAHARALLQGRATEPYPWVVLGVFGLLAVLAFYVRTLRRRGVLQ